MNNTTKILIPKFSDYYGNIVFRLAMVIDNFDSRDDLEAVGFQSQDEIIPAFVPETLQQAIKAKDLISYQIQYSKLLNQMLNTRFTMEDKQGWNHLIFAVFAEDNTGWDPTGTKYAASCLESNIKPCKKISIGVRESDFERFYKKHGRVGLRQYDFKTVDEAMGYLNRYYKEEQET